MKYAFSIFSLGYILLFPNAPLKLAVLTCIFVACLPYLIRDTRRIYPLTYIAFGIYVIILGIIYTQRGTDEELGRAMKTPAVMAMVGVISWVGLRPLKQTYLLIYGFLWNLFQFFGIILNRAGVDTHKVLPFPVTKVSTLRAFADTSIAEQLETQSRYFAFTAEGSIVTSTSAMFAIVTMLYVLRKWIRNERVPLPWLLLTGTTIMLAGATSVLAKTKAGLAVMTAFCLVTWLLLLLGRIELRKKVLSSVIIASLVGTMALGLVAYSVYDHKAAEYSQQEVERTATLLRKGKIEEDGGGTATRTEWAKLAVLGLIHTPWGVGASNGYEYAKPVLNKIEPTREMQLTFDDRIYNGYKAYFLNMIGFGGLFGIACYLFLLRQIYRDTTWSLENNIYGLGWGLVAALVVFSVCADEVPFFPIVSFFGCWAAATADREIEESSQYAIRAHA